MNGRLVLTIVVLTLLSASCNGLPPSPTSQPSHTPAVAPTWKQDPDVQAAKRDCIGLAEGERYTCIERHALDSLNPAVCRLAGMWVDDMCLQAVYEAAGDPGICAQLYLEGVRPNCHAYYASLAATTSSQPVTSTPTPMPTATPNLGKLAHVQGGDIWVKALPDEEPQRLTTDGRNSQPRWSPSGEWLAFRKDEQVWLTQADGNDPHPLWEGGPVSTFAWSPAEDRLAYVAGSDMLGLETINADGTDPTTLILAATGAVGQLGRIAWSPDGAWIAYEWLKQRAAQYLTYQGLWKVPADGGQRAELYVSGAPEKGEAILAGWSLDGKYILFWQGDILSASLLADGVPLYSLPAGGGEPVKLVDAVLLHNDFVASAPQGDRLAVTAGEYRATWTNKRVAVVEADGGGFAWLTDQGVATFSPAWSPDGVRLAYVAMPDRGDLVGGDDARLGMMERRIWVVNAQGEPQLQQLTDDPAYRDERPLWSAGGSHLLFVRLDAEGSASLWLIPFGGGASYLVADNLGPLPGPASSWFGYYGHVGWDNLFDWWVGSAEVE